MTMGYNKWNHFFPGYKICDKDVLLKTIGGKVYIGRYRYGEIGEVQPNIMAWRCRDSGKIISYVDAYMELSTLIKEPDESGGETEVAIEFGELPRPPICVECEFHQPPGLDFQHNCTVNQVLDVVTGKYVGEQIHCYSMRDEDGDCGPSGKLFKTKREKSCYE